MTTLQAKSFTVFLLLLTTTFIIAQPKGPIYQKYGGSHAGKLGSSYYHPDYLGGVNNQNQKCFNYSTGNNSQPEYEMRNATISYNAGRHQINSSSNVKRISTGQQTIKFVETDITSQAFRKTEFSYPDSAIGWFHSSQPGQSYNYMSGAVFNAQILPHPIFTNPSSVYNTGQGMIKRFELNANTNADIYTKYLRHFTGSPLNLNTDRYQDVIVKVIEYGEYIYAAGYCSSSPAFGEGKGLIYKIPKNYFDQTISCIGSGCAGAELYTYGNFISDIKEINGKIYFVGSMAVRGSYAGIIGNLDDNYVREDLNYECSTGAHGQPFNVSMNYNTNTNEIECILLDHHGSVTGIISYDLTLTTIMKFTAIDVNRVNFGNMNPNHQILASGAAPALLFKDLEYDKNMNIIMSGFVFLGGSAALRLSVTLDKAANLLKGSAYRLPVKMSASPTPLLKNSALSAVAPMQDLIVYVPSDTGDVLYSIENYKTTGPKITGVKRMDYNYLLNMQNDTCDDCYETSISIPISDGCVDLHHQGSLENEDFELQTNPFVHPLVIEEDYPMHCLDTVENGISGCPYWDSTIVFANMTTPFNMTTKICRGDEIRLGAMQKNFYGTSTLTWYRDNRPIDQDRLTITTDKTGTYHFEATRNQYNGSTCRFVSSPLVITETSSQIVAAPSDRLCDGQSATLSVVGDAPSAYVWTGGSTSPDIVSHIVPLVYNVTVTYPNTCYDVLSKPIYKKGITLSQNISETGTATETLSISVCNWEQSPINNVHISTNLVPDLIVNDAPNAGGWMQSNSTNTFIIGSIPAALDMYTPACTTITMQVKVNKCATALAVQGVFSMMTCPPIVSTRNYWDANNFTASITNATGVSCNAVPLTLNAAPGTGGYTYKWLRGTGTIPISTTNNCVANTSDRYHLSVGRNQCLQKSFIDIVMNPAISFTHTVQSSVCNAQGKIVITATGGLPPYQYSRNNGMTYQVSNTLNVNSGTHLVKVRDALNCTLSKSITVGKVNHTVNFLEVITPFTCVSSGSITIANPTTTGSCAAGTFTYLWSNGATTATISNLNPGNYKVTVTDCNSCAKVKTLTVPNHSNIVTADVVQSLMNCTVTPANVRYITYPSGGTQPYSYIWYRNGAQIATTSDLTTSDISNLSVKTTDANGYCVIKPITSTINFPVTHYLGSDYGLSKAKLSTAGLPASISNARIYVKGNLEIDMTTWWTNLDVIFEAPINASTSTSVIVKSPTSAQGLWGKNCHIHTCNFEMQKGVIVDNITTGFENCHIQDMYAAFQIVGNGNLQLYGNTKLENNFIGIKMLNHTASPFLTFPLPFQIIGGRTKTVASTRYNSANLLFSSLEPGTSMASSALTKSYAGIISDNSTGWTLTSNTTTPVQMSNLANGILVKGGNYYLSKIKFSNITDATNTFVCATCKKDNTIYAQGSTTTSPILHYTGFYNGTPDIQSSTNGVIAEDYNLQLQNVRMTVTGKAIDNRNTGAMSGTSYTKYNKILNSNIIATNPVKLQNYQTTEITNDTFADQGTSNIPAALVEVISLSGSSTIPSIPVAKISNNTFTINQSRFGLSVAGLSAFANIAPPITSTNAQVNISNNKFMIFNTGTGTNGTYTAVKFNTLKNVLILGNTLSKASTVPNYNLNTTNDAPHGIDAISIQNGTYSCNNFYTYTGSYFEGINNGLLIKTNNYSSPRFGMLFNQYNNTMAIPSNSNKFYCGCCGSGNTMFNLSGSAPSFKVNIDPQANQNLSSLCNSPIQITCNTPTPLPFIFNQISMINPAGGFTISTAGNTGDNSCQLICYNPPPVPQAPERKMTPSDRTDEIVSAPSCTLYPNPSTDKVKVEMNGIKSATGETIAWQVVITDIQGRRVYTQSHISENNSFDLIHDLPSGQYFVSISNGADVNFMERISVISNK